MGITYVDAMVTGPTGRQEALELLVDSGATYSLLPKQVWKALELEPTRELAFRLVDGTELVRQISRCWLSLENGADYTPVILGEPGDQPLLGTVTLQILGLVFHPLSRTFHPMRAILASAVGSSRESADLHTLQNSR